MPSDLIFPRLDDETAEEANSYDLKKLTSRDTDREDPYRAFRDVTVGLAPDFTIHAATLKIADAYRREGKLAEWIQKFNVTFPADRPFRSYEYDNPLIPHAPFEERGLFIPRARKEAIGEYHKGFGTPQATDLFNGHMANYAIDYEKGRPPVIAYGAKVAYPSVITGRHWTPYDFDNAELMSLARTKFIPDIWKGLERNYKSMLEYEKGQLITNLCDRLHAYYKLIIEQCSRDE